MSGAQPITVKPAMDLPLPFWFGTMTTATFGFDNGRELATVCGETYDSGDVQAVQRSVILQVIIH
ncbi:hypothetical protein INR49_017698 [Caranx melampygus]|nr:hypothetical protein INR49_017698 [Caranx melampygus]